MTALDYASGSEAAAPEDLLNAGIAMVVPAHKILETLAHEEQLAIIAAAEERATREHPTYLDGGSPVQVKASDADALKVAVSGAIRQGVSLSSTPAITFTTRRTD